jgi:ADP-ribosylglycohydrolase
MSDADRAAGCLVGLALGEALGGPFRGRMAAALPRRIPSLDELAGRGEVGTADATALARNLVRSLVATGGTFDPADVRRRHVAWLASDPPVVGGLTRRVLTRAAAGDAAAAHDYVEERGPEVSADNGSVCYCAPLGAALARRPAELVRDASVLSAITHWDERCRTACVAVALTASALVRGEAPDHSVRSAVEAVQGLAGAEELEYLIEAAGSIRPVDGPDRRFVFFATGIALRTVAEAPEVTDGLRAVVAEGGDAARNAAVTGALLGAAVGRSGLPRGWIDRLADGEAILDEAGSLARLAGSDRESGGPRTGPQ